MAYLTYLGASAGSPNEIDLAVPKQYEAGKLVAAQSGCLACHKIGENGNGGPGPNLSDIARQAARRRRSGARWTTRPRRCRPSAGLDPAKKAALVDFLAQLRGEKTVTQNASE